MNYMLWSLERATDIGPLEQRSCDTGDEQSGQSPSHLPFPYFHMTCHYAAFRRGATFPRISSDVTLACLTKSSSSSSHYQERRKSAHRPSKL